MRSGRDRQLFARGTLNAITQSAVSQQIRSLEKHFHVGLIERGRKNFSVTPEGRAFLQASKEILHSFESLGARISELQNVVAGELRIATIYSIGLHELPPFLKKFRAVYPDVTVKVDYRRSTQVYGEVLEGNADLGLVAFPTQRKGLIVEDFWRDKLVLICHPGHSLAERKRVRLRDLQGEKFISFEPDLPTRKVIDRLLREQGVEIDQAMEFDNIETVKRAVEIENGISIVPQTSVADETRNKAWWRSSWRARICGGRWVWCIAGTGRFRRRRSSLSLSSRNLSGCKRRVCWAGRQYSPRPGSGRRQRRKPLVILLIAFTTTPSEMIRAGLLIGLGCLLACWVLLLGAHWWIERKSAAYVADRQEDLPPNEVGMILGTSARLSDGTRNQHFENRVAAGAALYHAGLVRRLLLSGNHESPDYDEPADMEKLLLAAGVPHAALTHDDAGLRTLDSVVRAEKVFGLHKMTIITDRFHCYRARFPGAALRDGGGRFPFGGSQPALLDPLAYSRMAGGRESLPGCLRSAHPAKIPRKAPSPRR